MGLIINERSLWSRRFLKVRKRDVQYYGASLWGARRFRFDQIDNVLMSPTHQLSFQVGQEVFSIATRPDKPKHQAVIAALLEAVGQSRPRTG